MENTINAADNTWKVQHSLGCDAQVSVDDSGVSATAQDDEANVCKRLSENNNYDNTEDSDDDFVLEEEERRHSVQAAQASNGGTPLPLKHDYDQGGGRVHGADRCPIVGHMSKLSRSQEESTHSFVHPIPRVATAAASAAVAKVRDWDDNPMHPDKNPGSLSAKSLPFVCPPTLNVMTQNFKMMLDPHEEDLELTGSALDEPMTPQSYSSMRIHNEMKKCGHASSLICGNNNIGSGKCGGRFTSSNGSFQCSSNTSTHHLHGLRRSEVLLSETGFHTNEARRPPLPLPAHLLTDSNPDVRASSVAQLSVTSRKSDMESSFPSSTHTLHDTKCLCGRQGESTCPRRSSCLPPEPTDLASVNEGRLRSTSFMNNVVVSCSADKYVVSNHQKLLNEKYVIYPKWSLGVGSYSKVVLCYNLEDKLYYAMKVLDRVKLHRMGLGVECALHKVKCEIAIMKKLRHRNIVALVEVIDDPRSRKIYLILELAEHGEIMSLRDDGTVVSNGENPVLSEREVVRVMRSIVNAAMYVHRLGIAHRDIKPQNILLTAEGDVKLSDFGVSIIVDDSAVRVRREGSVAFLPPEMLVSPEVKVAPPTFRFSNRRNNTACSDGGSNVCSSSSIGKLHSTVTLFSSTATNTEVATSSATATSTTTGMRAKIMTESHLLTEDAAPKLLKRSPQVCCSNIMKNLPEPKVSTHAASAPTFATTCSTVRNAYLPLASCQNAPQVDLFKADVFSLGVTAFVLLMGRLPWLARDTRSQLNAILAEPDPFAEEFRRAYGNPENGAQRSYFPEDPNSRNGIFEVGKTHTHSGSSTTTIFPWTANKERNMSFAHSVHFLTSDGVTPYVTPSQASTTTEGRYDLYKQGSNSTPSNTTFYSAEFQKELLESKRYNRSVSHVGDCASNLSPESGRCPLAGDPSPLLRTESNTDDDAEEKPGSPSVMSRIPAFTTFDSIKRVQDGSTKRPQYLPETENRGSISAEAIDFIHCCLKVDPTERSTMEELYNHLWIQKLIASEKEGGGEMASTCHFTTDASKNANSDGIATGKECMHASSAAADHKHDEREVKEEDRKKGVENEQELVEVGDGRLIPVVKSSSGDHADSKESKETCVNHASCLSTTQVVDLRVLDHSSLQSIGLQRSPLLQNIADAAVSPVFDGVVRTSSMHTMSAGTLTLSALTSPINDALDHHKTEDVVSFNGICKTPLLEKVSLANDTKSLHTEATLWPTFLCDQHDLSEDVGDIADAVTPAIHRPRRLTNSEEVAIPVDLASKLLGGISVRLGPFRRRHFDEDPSFKYGVDDNCTVLRGLVKGHPDISSRGLRSKSENVRWGHSSTMRGKEKYAPWNLKATTSGGCEGDGFHPDTSLSHTSLEFASMGKPRRWAQYHERSLSCPE